MGIEVRAVSDRSRRIMAAVLALLAIALILASAAGTAEKANVKVSKLYVVCKGDNVVRVLNVSSGAVERTIQVGSQPVSITLSGNGRRALVANSGDGTISLLDTVNDSLLNSYRAEDGPWKAAFSLDNSLAYVSNHNTYNVYIIDLASGDRLTSAQADFPSGIAAGDDGLLYVASTVKNTVNVVDPATGEVLRKIPVGGSPSNIVVVHGGPLLVANTGGASVSFIDTASHNVTYASAGNGAYDIAVSPDGRTAYVTNMNEKSVSVLGVLGQAQLGEITVGNMPMGVAVSDDGCRAYVANSGSDLISVINASLKRVESTIPVGKTPCDVAYVSYTIQVDVTPTPEPFVNFGSDADYGSAILILLVLAVVGVAAVLSYHFMRKP